jgi:lysozyme family protein
MIENFNKSFALLIKSEGGFVQDPHDSGGATNLGVTIATWKAYVNRPVSVQEIKDLTPVMVKPLYKQNYWNPSGCDILPSGVDYVVFDFAVNAGVKRAIKCLQKAVGADADGVLGSITQALIRQSNPMDVVEHFTEEKIAFYKSLNNPYFEKGWLARADTVESNAEQMVQNA